MERYVRIDFKGVESITEEQSSIVVRFTNGNVAVYKCSKKNIKIMNGFKEQKRYEEPPNPFKQFEFNNANFIRWRDNFHTTSGWRGSRLSQAIGENHPNLFQEHKKVIPPFSKGVGKKKGVCKKKIVGQKKSKAKPRVLKLKLVRWRKVGSRIIMEYNNGVVEAQSIFSYKSKGDIPPLAKREEKKEAYRRKTPDNTWKPPHYEPPLLQEEHAHDPWKVMVICILLNRATGEQVKRVMPEFFKLCPDAETCAQVPADEITKAIHSLGFQEIRPRILKRFSLDYLKDTWTHVTQLYGVGRYAADAYAILCTGRWKDVVPWDHKLVDYWRFLNRHNR